MRCFKSGQKVKAKLPKGDWLWPAIWLLPYRNQYGMWPASGEIDIMESRGNTNYPQSAEGGVESFGSTLHWGVDWTQVRDFQDI
jgi:beta-glucanase (GH16 family)